MNEICASLYAAEVHHMTMGGGSSEVKFDVMKCH